MKQKGARKINKSSHTDSLTFAQGNTSENSTQKKHSFHLLVTTPAFAQLGSPTSKLLNYHIIPNMMNIFFFFLTEQILLPTVA